MKLLQASSYFYKLHKGKRREHLVEDLHRFVELYIPQERGQVLEEINQQLCVHGPTLEDISVLHQNPKNIPVSVQD